VKKCHSPDDALPAVRHDCCTAEEATHSTVMLTTTLLVIWKLLIPLLLLVAVIDWLTASEDRRVRILRRTGLSQLQIATRLNISRYRVRKALAS
jgi:hypothetical protein